MLGRRSKGTSRDDVAWGNKDISWFLGGCSTPRTGSPHQSGPRVQVVPGSWLVRGEEWASILPPKEFWAKSRFLLQAKRNRPISSTNTPLMCLHFNCSKFKEMIESQVDLFSFRNRTRNASYWYVIDPFANDSSVLWRMNVALECCSPLHLRFSLILMNWVV